MIRIIPAIDLMDGKCVRLQQGDYSRRSTYGTDPVEMAVFFEERGFTRLHLVDLDGARKGRIVHYKLLEKIAGETQLDIDYGGGIKSDRDLEKVFDCGARWATTGSYAVHHPEGLMKWIRTYGPDKFILGADVRNGKIFVNGWQKSTELNVFSFIDHYKPLGINKILCTDIGRDGMMKGANTRLYREIMDRFEGLELIASGGVSGITDVEELNEAGIPGVVVGKALFEGQLDLQELTKFRM